MQVLHLLLFALTQRPYDEQLLTAMRVDEMLVDIGDDLVVRAHEVQCACIARADMSTEDAL